jgi:hypothetical protein
LDEAFELLTLTRFRSIDASEQNTPNRTLRDAKLVQIAEKNEPQLVSSRGSTPSELRVRGWGLTRRMTLNDTAEGLFRPRSHYFEDCAKGLTDPGSPQPCADWFFIFSN